MYHKSGGGDFLTAIVLMSAFSALCALWPGFAAWACANVSAPLTAFLACAAPFSAIMAFIIKPRLITIALIFCLTWAPPMAMPQRNIPEASQSDLIALCRTLTEELNALERSVPEANEALTIAQRVMNSPSAPRAAYFPGIMRRLSLAGIYIPVTGEAIVDTSRPAAGLIFTAAHELAHMQGIACETKANIAAYEACIYHGGAAEYSAKIWALAYALSRLENEEITFNIAPEIRNDIQNLPVSGENCAQYARLADYLANSQK